jgi:hypothetical protein
MQEGRNHLRRGSGMNQQLLPEPKHSTQSIVAVQASLDVLLLNSVSVSLLKCCFALQRYKHIALVHFN